MQLLFHIRQIQQRHGMAGQLQWADFHIRRPGEKLSFLKAPVVHGGLLCRGICGGAQGLIGQGMAGTGVQYPAARLAVQPAGKQ